MTTLQGMKPISNQISDAYFAESPCFTGLSSDDLENLNDDETLWAIDDAPTQIEDGEALMNCFNTEKCQIICNQIERGKDLLTSLLPNEIVFSLCEYLDVKSLLSLGTCSTNLHSLTSRNEASWSSKCEQLWESKSLICAEAQEMLNQRNRAKRAKHECCYFNKNNINVKVICTCESTCSKSAMENVNAKEAYKLAVIDAKQRNEITERELCGLTWSFRFKETAGQDWTASDPWWNGSNALKMIFLPDGRIKQVDASCTINMNDNKKRSSLSLSLNQYHSTSSRGRSSPMESIDMRWRFITAPLDLSPRPIGGYLRLSVGGREVPTYVVRRSPTGNWGFVMESCWGVYSSFDMPCRGSAHKLEDDDLLVTNLRQWREALLYNNGANKLPEGKMELDEFNSIWNQAFHINRDYQ